MKDIAIYSLDCSQSQFDPVFSYVEPNVTQFLILSAFKTSNSIIEEFKQCTKVLINLQCITQNIFGVSVEAWYTFCVTHDSDTKFTVNQDTAAVRILSIFMENK